VRNDWAKYIGTSILISDPDLRQFGTGFAVMAPLPNDRFAIDLITNKHVLGASTD
jgi:hypothetical protein